MDVSSVAAYRAMQRELFPLPSGAVFEIRAVQQWDFIELGELPVPSASVPAVEEPVSLNSPTVQYMKRYNG